MFCLLTNQIMGVWKARSTDVVILIVLFTIWLLPSNTASLRGNIIVGVFPHSEIPTWSQRQSSPYIRESKQVINPGYKTDLKVARIAYHCSDVVFSVQPNVTNSGSFSSALDRLYSAKTLNLLRGDIPQVLHSRS
jgi:hypothetical protein